MFKAQKYRIEWTGRLTGHRRTFPGTVRNLGEAVATTERLVREGFASKTVVLDGAKRVRTFRRR